MAAQQNVGEDVGAAFVHTPDILRVAGAAGQRVDALVGGLGVGGGQERRELGHSILQRLEADPTPSALELVALCGTVGVDCEHRAAQRLAEHRVAGPPAPGQDCGFDRGGVGVAERFGGLGDRPDPAEIEDAGGEGRQGCG